MPFEIRNSVLVKYIPKEYETTIKTEDGFAVIKFYETENCAPKNGKQNERMKRKIHKKA